MYYDDDSGLPPNNTIIDDAMYLLLECHSPWGDELDKEEGKSYLKTIKSQEPPLPSDRDKYYHSQRRRLYIDKGKFEADHYNPANPYDPFTRSGNISHITPKELMKAGMSEQQALFCRYLLEYLYRDRMISRLAISGDGALWGTNLRQDTPVRTRTKIDFSYAFSKLVRWVFNNESRGLTEEEIAAVDKIVSLKKPCLLSPDQPRIDDLDKLKNYCLTTLQGGKPDVDLNREKSYEEWQAVQQVERIRQAEATQKKREEIQTKRQPVLKKYEVLIAIQEKLLTQKYQLHGGGTKIIGSFGERKLVSKGAALVLKILKDIIESESNFNRNPGVNMLDEEQQYLNSIITQIKELLQDKCKKTNWSFFYFGARSDTTIKLYQDIIDQLEPFKDSQESDTIASCH